MTGKFVTFEGCEGVGKSTQVKKLKEYLVSRGINAVFTREPGGTPISEQIRTIILDPENKSMDDVTELMLYAAARRQHTQEFIKPRLENGETVICDRYIDSTTAYQGYARGLGSETVENLNALAVGDVNIDLTIFLDLSPERAFDRKGGRDEGDRLENEKMEFHKRVYDGFCKIAEKYPGRVVRVDASGSKQQTHEKIIKTLIERGIIPAENDK
ncbi:MAG: dTMP kinase [Firmicutes bacterium]|nr:dTMP kinase [Bacillota bacterium]MDY5531674.1 dTMP kinase [Pumilibacteraceae bacterium]